MFRQITSIAGPHFGEIRNIKPPLSGPIIVNSIIDFGKHTDKLEFVGRADSQVVTNVVCNRSQPDPLGIVLWYANLEFAEGSQGVEQHCHSEPVRFPGVGISIDFQAAFRLTS